MINHVFISFSAVQMHDISYIHLYNSISACFWRTLKLLRRTLKIIKTLKTNHFYVFLTTLYMYLKAAYLVLKQHWNRAIVCMFTTSDLPRLHCTHVWYLGIKVVSHLDSTLRCAHLAEELSERVGLLKRGKKNSINPRTRKLTHGTTMVQVGEEWTPPPLLGFPSDKAERNKFTLISIPELALQVDTIFAGNDVIRRPFDLPSWKRYDLGFHYFLKNKIILEFYKKCQAKRQSFCNLTKKN